MLKILDELPPFVVAMHRFDSLLQGDGDEQADTNGGDVDEEVAPGVGRGVGRVNVEHKREDRG
jgi:hypothetical protein